MKNLVLLLITFFVSSFCKAQSYSDWLIVEIVAGTRIELTSFDEKAFLSFGPKYPINEKNYISLRGHFNWWDANDRKFIVIPELDYIYRISKFEGDKSMITSFQTGVGITPNAFSPKIGLSFYHIFTFEIGNNFEFKEYKQFSTAGFRFSFGINVIY